METFLLNCLIQTLPSNRGVRREFSPVRLIGHGPRGAAGPEVEWPDVEGGYLSGEQVVEAVRKSGLEIILTGHAGSTPANPVCLHGMAVIKAIFPQLVNIYADAFCARMAASSLRETEGAASMVTSDTVGRAFAGTLGRRPKSRRDFTGTREEPYE